MNSGTPLEPASSESLLAFGPLILSNLAKAGLSEEHLSYYRQHRDQIPHALRRGFVLPEEKRLPVAPPPPLPSELDSLFSSPQQQVARFESFVLRSWASAEDLFHGGAFSRENLTAKGEELRERFAGGFIRPVLCGYMGVPKLLELITKHYADSGLTLMYNLIASESVRFNHDDRARLVRPEWRVIDLGASTEVDMRCPPDKLLDEVNQDDLAGEEVLWAMLQHPLWASYAGCANVRGQHLRVVAPVIAGFRIKEPSSQYNLIIHGFPTTGKVIIGRINSAHKPDPDSRRAIPRRVPITA